MKKKSLLTSIILTLILSLCLIGLTACGDKEVSFKLKFVVDNEIYATIDTSGDEVIQLPENPTKENHSFDGWFWDKDVWEKPFTANSLLDAPLSSDMSVYAKFSLNTINGVTFEDVETTYDGTEKTITVNNLPNGASVVYDKANTYINAGEYTVTAIISQDNYEDLQLTATLTINKATVQIPTQDTTSFVYNGNEQTYIVAENNLYAVNGNKQTNAGNYNVIVSLKDKANYQWRDNNSTDLSYSFNIAKATYDMSSVVFDDKTVTYNGDSHSIIATGAPSGVTVDYENNDNINAGKYTVVAKFTGDSNNYELIPNKTATLTILDSAFEGLSFESKTFTYDGTEKKIEVVGAPSDATITYDKANKYINAGKYTVTATIKKANFAEATLTATLTINKTTYDMSGVVFTDKTVTYNGDTHSIEAQNVPNGLEVSYVGNGKINADVYTVTDKFTDKTGNYENPADMTATLTINKATLTGITFTDKTFTYDTKAHSIKITGNIPTCVNVTYTNNDKVNADAYTVTASFEDTSGNYIVPENMSAKLIIQKANVTGITFSNKTFTYNGTKRSLQISGTLPSEVTVDYVNNGKINADTYTVIATFTCETDNYNVPEDMTATLTIKKAVYDMNAVTFDNKTVTYNGKTQSLAVSDNLPSGVTVNYTNNNQVDVGQYVVVATFTGDSINYYPIDDMQAILTINKATYDMSKVQFVGGRFTYDGTPKSIYVTGELPQGVTVEYTNNGKVNANAYTVTATFTGDTKNYNKLNDWSASLIIDKATYDMSGVSFKNQTFTYDKTEKSALISGNLPKGVQVSYVGNEKIDVGTYSVTAKFNGDSNNYHLIEDMTATLKINQAVPYINEVSCDSTLNVYSKVELIADTDVKGTITLDNGQALTLGYKTYSWTFIPEDTHNYTTTTGTVGLNVCALVSYYNDGVLFSSQNIVLNNSAYIPTGTPLREDGNGYTYTFSHWSIEENGAEYNFTNAITADLNLYAVYDSEEIVYAVNYYDTKGVEHDNITAYTVLTEYTLLNIEKEHYVFNGWVDEDGKKVTKINKGTFGALNLYATWTPIEYTITYDLAYRGAVNGNNPTTYNVEDTFSFENASYDEYHAFAGWYLDKDFTTPISSICVGEFGDITLYAKWNFSGTYIYTANDFKNITYKMNGVYELKNDITIDFTLGDETNPFTGYFLGNDYSIKGNSIIFSINSGYIAYLKTNKELCFTNNGTIYMCSSYGICFDNEGLINNCISYAIGFADFSTYSSTVYGGIVANNRGRIESCVAKLNETIKTTFGYRNQTLYIGGIAGNNWYNAIIRNCYVEYNLALTVGNHTTGTLNLKICPIAYNINSYSDEPEIVNCYVTGKISFERLSAGGSMTTTLCTNSTDIGVFIALDEIPPYPTTSIATNFYNCYYNQDLYTSYISGGIMCNKLNIKSREWIIKNLKWDENIWYLQDGQYPKLWFEVE